MAKEKRPPLRALAALIRSRTARALPRATPYPLCICLGAPLATRTLHVSLTYLLWALPAAAVPADPAGPAPALPAPRGVRSGRPANKTPQEASLIYIIESSRAFPPSGDPARCAYGKGRT